MLSDITNQQINKIASDIKAPTASRNAVGRIDSCNSKAQAIRM